MAPLTVPQSLLGRLAALDACACSDAMDQLGMAGVAYGLRPLTVARRVAGPVITVALGPAASAAADGSAGRHLGSAAIDAAQSGDVIVVAASGRVDAAGWGGVLSLAATVRGVSGVIVDGACRDVDESASLDLPVYALAAVPATARGRQVEVGWNTSVEIAGVAVEPGDLVVADGSGVVFLPARRAAEIIDAAERIAAREADMARRLRAGEAASAVLSADYEQMLTTRREST
ncbi:MAG: RraA family protein [Actinobacteria bacterium]|nr:RraA family protein [Actinomycetota bacterium]MBO0831122.1 RraA family protein [Actinomycetota bacterium]MBO0835421.1 RraA family protein [Actinomycetota bacterium]